MFVCDEWGHGYQKLRHAMGLKSWFLLDPVIPKKKLKSSQKKIKWVVVVHVLCARGVFIHKHIHTQACQNWHSIQKHALPKWTVHLPTRWLYGHSVSLYHFLWSCSTQLWEEVTLFCLATTQELQKHSKATSALHSWNYPKDLTYSKACNIHEDWISKAFHHLDHCSFRWDPFQVSRTCRVWR